MSSYYILFSIAQFIIWPVILIGLIAFFIRRRRKKVHPTADSNWYLQFSLSKEDAASQFFMLLSIFFLGVTILSFNSDWGDPLSWRMILLITATVGLFIAYHVKIVLALAVSLLSLAGWWGAQAVEWTLGKNIRSSAIFAGLALVALLFYVLGYAHQREKRWQRFALVYLIFGIISVTGILFFLSTRLGLEFLESMTRGVPFFGAYGSWPITLSLLLLFSVLVGVASYAANKRLLSKLEFIAAISLAFLFGLMAMLPEQKIGSGQILSGAGVLWAVIFNLVAFFELLGLILAGYARRETWLINLGALFLFLLIVVKYFDWFFTFLNKSLFFIGAGILLFVVGWFMEKGRRYMIANIKAQASSTVP